MDKNLLKLHLLSTPAHLFAIYASTSICYLRRHINLLSTPAHPFAIYAGTEFLLQKIDTCHNSPKR